MRSSWIGGLQDLSKFPQWELCEFWFLAFTARVKDLWFYSEHIDQLKIKWSALPHFVLDPHLTCMQSRILKNRPIAGIVIRYSTRFPLTCEFSLCSPARAKLSSKFAFQLFTKIQQRRFVNLGFAFGCRGERERATDFHTLVRRSRSEKHFLSL